MFKGLSPCFSAARSSSSSSLLTSSETRNWRSVSEAVRACRNSPRKRRSRTWRARSSPLSHINLFCWDNHPFGCSFLKACKPLHAVIALESTALDTFMYRRRAEQIQMFRTGERKKKEIMIQWHTEAEKYKSKTNRQRKRRRQWQNKTKKHIYITSASQLATYNSEESLYAEMFVFAISF